MGARVNYLHGLPGEEQHRQQPSGTSCRRSLSLTPATLQDSGSHARHTTRGPKLGHQESHKPTGKRSDACLLHEVPRDTGESGLVVALPRPACLSGLGRGLVASLSTTDWPTTTTAAPPPAVLLRRVGTPHNISLPPLIPNNPRPLAPLAPQR
ncbi:hypothetical protein E2C01_064894 [Portunus trituberculatus]|uniref:Uncharacterized protein n=1 Tax=Portunus trituberculatus TaxID=210409 RepID=A0A5B7HLL0_PORTR|nr:hypothetical protein [Portunus trituberculatus]